MASPRLPAPRPFLSFAHARTHTRARARTHYLATPAHTANLVLQDTIERIYVGDCFGDIDRGIYLVRGENVVLLGEIDSMKDENQDLREVWLARGWPAPGHAPP